MKTPGQPRQSAAATILVVDDESSIRKFVFRVLNEAGYVTAVAGDGHDALAIASTLASIDLLLTDVVMPEMNGDELARRLCVQQPDLKVLYFTGFSDRLFKDKGQLWDGEAFLDKPCTAEGLLEAVGLLLTGHITPKGKRVRDRVKGMDTSPGPGLPLDPSALLRALIASSDDAIISKDLQGTITSWNPAAERMFGYEATEAIGRSIRMIIPADRQDEETTVLDRIKRGETISHYETVRCRKDGTCLPISLTVSPVRVDGTVIGASKIARDITERKRAEEERETLVRELKMSLAEVKTLQEILPICSYCHNIRDDKDYWQSVESYIAQHTNSSFTHSICPSCYRSQVEPQFGETKTE